MTSSPGVMFPFISARFFKQDKDTPSLQSKVRSPQDNRLVAPPPPTRPSLQVLDLQTLPRDDGAPTELRNRKEKLAHYEVQCSHVGGRLYVGGEVVARSLDILRASSITHVINCVGFLYPPYFEHEFIYQTLYLQGAFRCLCVPGQPSRIPRSESNCFPATDTGIPYFRYTGRGHSVRLVRCV